MSDGDIEWIRNNVEPPIAREYDDRNVWIWDYPLSEHDYVISADVSRGDAKDYSTFHVIDTTEGKCVAEYKGKIRPDTFAELLNEYGLKYNKALLCPENNSYGYATILKLQELKYPRIYYRRKKGVYIGDYVPPSSVETAGFNTNGKTRGTILSKLEEVLRNKQIIIKSSRFYEELKTFTWSSGKAQAKRGYHDDLVMSFAIGTWLFDAAGGYSKDSKALNDAMLSAMKRDVKHYDGTPENVIKDVGGGHGSKKIDPDTHQKQIKSLNVKNRNQIPADMMWVLK
jgi:hypothetical protein